MIEKLLIPGVIAAAYDDHNDTKPKFAGEQRWENEIRTTLHLLDISNAPTLRVTIGEHTIVAREGVAVVIPTGHAVAKSLQRTLSRFAAKLRNAAAAA